MFSAITFSIILSFSIAPAEVNKTDNQTTSSIDTTWVTSVLKGEKLNQLLKKEFGKKQLSGHIITPDTELTESMPIISPPPVDEGIFIPEFKKEKSTKSRPLKTD
ncbi:MAG: hypothetical protein EA391_01845 [Balneolaceae bacterium]|nr:MAG: hypothetical protein EA391_01845 [Balneolaceae bacterium]